MFGLRLWEKLVQSEVWMVMVAKLMWKGVEF